MPTDAEELEYARLRVLDVVALAEQPIFVSDVFEKLRGDVTREWARLALFQLANEKKIHFGYDLRVLMPK